MNFWDKIKFKTGSTDTKLGLLKDAINDEIRGIGSIIEIKTDIRPFVKVTGKLGDDKGFDFEAIISDLFFYEGEELIVTFKDIVIKPEWLLKLIYKLPELPNIFYIDKKYKTEFSNIKKLLQTSDDSSFDIEKLRKRRMEDLKPEDFKENEDSFLTKLGAIIAKAGRLLVEKALVLFYCWQDEDTPKWAKLVIAAALLYLISPVDAVPDTIPFLGFSDDAAVLTGAMKTVFLSIKKEHKQKAKEKVDKLFGMTDK